MIKTYRDLITYCENFQYSAEYYELYKEASELDLMKQYIVSHQYAAYVESSDLMDEILMEAIDPEKLKRMITNFGAKASEFGSKIVQKLKEFIPKVIKFFRLFANKIFKSKRNEIKFDANEFRKEITNDNTLNKYIQLFIAFKISNRPNEEVKQDIDEITKLIQSIISSNSIKLYDLSNNCKGLVNPKKLAGLIDKAEKTKVANEFNKLSKIKSIDVILDADEINDQCDQLQKALDSLSLLMDSLINITNTPKDATKDRLNFIDNAIAGKYNPMQAQAELDRLKRQYGDSAFLPGSIKYSPRPWTIQTLTDLILDVSLGNSSEEVLKLLADVGYTVNKNNKHKFTGLRFVPNYDRVTHLNYVYTIAASTLDFYNRFAKLYDQIIKLVNETLE